MTYISTNCYICDNEVNLNTCTLFQYHATNIAPQKRLPLCKICSVEIKLFLDKRRGEILFKRTDLQMPTIKNTEAK